MRAPGLELGYYWSHRLRRGDDGIEDEGDITTIAAMFWQTRVVLDGAIRTAPLEHADLVDRRVRQ
jgi:hypothetical protein